MSDEKRYTERKMVMAQREAFVMGAAGQRIAMREGISCWSASIEAAGRYPLPKVTRPRELMENDGSSWRFRDGELEHREARTTVWWRACLRGWEPTRCRIRLWADLLNNPTEEVEDEG